MTYVIMNVVLYTLNPDNTMEILESKIPTMAGLDGKINQITAIISNWAQAILDMKLQKEGEILTCQVRVVETANISIYIDIMLNGQHLEELPAEYIIEFDKGMPELVKQIYGVLRLNFKVSFTATNYIASDIYEALKQRMPALAAEYTLPKEIGWYRIAYSWYGTGSCTGMVSFVTDEENISETGVFAVATSCGQNGNVIQQIQRSRKQLDAHITKARLVVSSRAYAENRAYIDIYKDSTSEQTISILIADGRGFIINEQPEFIEEVPSQFEIYEITFTDGGLTADRIKGVTVKASEINQLAGIKENVQHQLDSKSPTKHSSTNTTYGASSATEYGHAKASSTLPLVAGTAAVGTEETAFARGNHVHPVQTTVKYAEQLKDARKITLSGAAAGGTDAFTLASDVTLKVNTLNASALTEKVPVACMPSLEEYGAEPAFAKNTAFNKKFETDKTVLKQPGTVSVGSSENIARADHVHPAQTTIEGKAKSAEKLETARTIAIAGSVVGAATAFDGTKNISITASTLKAEALTGTGSISITGNAGSATKLATARTIALSGGAVGTATSFNGTADITIPVTAVDATKLTGTVPVANMPTLAAYGAEPKFTKNTAFNKTFETDTSVIKQAGTVSVGSSEHIARADHVHPAQTTITGNAGSATKLATARTIALSGGAVGTATSFNGTADITIPVTAVDATKLTGTVPVANMPSLATYGAVAVAQGANHKNKHLIVNAEGKVIVGNLYGYVVDTYADLETALSTHRDADIILGADLVATKELTVGANNTINLNGHTIASDQTTHRFLTVNNDLTIYGPGSITNFKGDANGGCIAVASEKTCTLKNVTFIGCESSAAYGGCIYTQGTLVADNVVIRSCKETGVGSVGSGGSAICVGGGTCTLYAIDISQCTSLMQGGAIYVGEPNGVCTMYSGSIHDCYGMFCGGVYVEDAGTFELKGGTIAYCRSVTQSGGILVRTGGQLTVSSSAVVKDNYNNDGLYNILCAGTFFLENFLLGSVSLHTDTLEEGQTLGSCSPNSMYAYNIINDAKTHHGKLDPSDNTKLIWESNT